MRTPPTTLLARLMHAEGTGLFPAQYEGPCTSTRRVGGSQRKVLRVCDPHDLGQADVTSMWGQKSTSQGSQLQASMVEMQSRVSSRTAYIVPFTCSLCCTVTFHTCRLPLQRTPLALLRSGACRIAADVGGLPGDTNSRLLQRSAAAACFYRAYVL